MGTLYLVRHGQASLGAADYDQLSALGHRQCVRLGAWFRQRGTRFDAVFTGTLRRHVQSLAGIEEGLQSRHDPTALPGLNEYDSEALLRAVHAGPLPKPESPEQVRQHFRLLREALTQWMNGNSQPLGMPSFDGFTAGVVAALDQVRQQHAGDVLLVSSGGPIATAVGHVLGTPASTVIELNMRIRNSALTEFAFSAKRHALLSFNALPHLDQVDPAHWVTYA